MWGEGVPEELGGDHEEHEVTVIDGGVEIRGCPERRGAGGAGQHGGVDVVGVDIIDDTLATRPEDRVVAFTRRVDREGRTPGAAAEDRHLERPTDVCVFGGGVGR